MSNDEIIERVNAFLKVINEHRQNEEDDLLMKSHILTYKEQPEKTILIAINEDYEDCFIYRPLSGKNLPAIRLDDDIDATLFEYLEDGYDIAEMDMKIHASVWFNISDFGVEWVQSKQGFQKYLEYCLKNGITLDKIKKEYDYEYKDLFGYYKVDAKKDPFMHIENYKDEPWYDDVVLYSRIGVCKTKPEYAKEVCKALSELGYPVQLKVKGEDLFVMPRGKNRDAKETEAR